MNDTDKLLLELARRDEQLAKWDMLYGAKEGELTAALAALDTHKHYTDRLEDCAKGVEKDLTAALAREIKLREALQEVADHAPADLEPEDGARWVGMGTMMKVCAALSTTGAEVKP